MNHKWQVPILLSFLLFVPGNSARALTFHADLSTIHVEAMPGEVISRDFMLSLPTTESATQFRLRVQDFYRSEDLKQLFYKDPGTFALSCGPWIQLNPVETIVEPGTTMDAKISIAVPGDVKPGGYWCALCVEQVPNPLAAPAATGRVGMRCLAAITLGIYVNILPVQRSGKITAVSVTGQSATVTVADTGNCPLFATGRFEFVKPGETKPFATIPISKTTILPQPVNTAQLGVALPSADQLPAGHYLVRAIIDIGLDHYIGVQKEMDLSRDDGPATQSHVGSQ